MLSIREVRKDYRLGKSVIQALKGVSFEVERGDFVSIVGPSGCGKTSLLNIIGCIDRPTEGAVFFEGRDITALTDDEAADSRLSKIGFIFQSFNLVPVLSVYENIEFPLVLAGVRTGERKQRIDRLVEIVGLSDYIKHRPDELSGGQRQRVAIARALVNNPSLVIADEPTANLDSETGNAILEEMKILNDRENVTFVFSTHNPEILKYAKRIVRLKDGLIHDMEFVNGRGR